MWDETKENYNKLEDDIREKISGNRIVSIKEVSYNTWRDKLDMTESKDKRAEYRKNKARIGLEQRRLTSVANNWKYYIRFKHK